MLILLGGNIIASSQLVNKRHSISISAAALHLGDISVLKTSVDGTGRGFKYSYTRITGSRYSVVSAGWKHGLFNSGSSRLKLNDFSVMLSDGFLIDRNKHSPFKAWLGYSVEVNPSFVKLQNKAEEKYSWSSVNSLNLYQFYTYQYNKSIFSFSVHVPLIGFSSRPGHSTQYPTDINGLLYNSYSNLSLTSFHNYKTVNLDLNYMHRINAKWNFIAGLNYRYSDLETTLPVRLQSAGIQAGLSLKID